MTITPGELLDTSIAQLRTLAAFLGDQLPEGGGTDTDSVRSANPALRACEEVLVSLELLIPKLQAAHDALSERAQKTGRGSVWR